MFDFDLSKLLLIGVVALIFIPPKDLPQALRQLGRVLGQARRMATDFRAQFDEALRESELHELKDEFAHLKQKASLEGTMNRIADMIEPAPKSAEAAQAPDPIEAPLFHEALPPPEQHAELPKPIERAELPPPTPAEFIPPESATEIKS